ncbi:UDP-N-acetylmuramoyl-L-alanyl-D-glutamate--2,6-diaminopimelate ligase [Indiicoccus explosivorum]|uniref:UDP-N-acetylmuramoyl-L-alanyl-D-glutamate--2, 6-diaminopimelate ligase n=2 Tax=Indiicoccus explosivorum TaxID=1917864 RepID=UPI000B4535DB|nr:UDP-N-acetylmuramoyl-L-alanyl-D-glutamate--2,6-diaminopimelate ligase [Indiicoccus explosivorum]
MNLQLLLNRIPMIHPLPAQAAEIEITGITDNSKLADSGSLFVAVKGFCDDGHEYIRSAIQHGAAAIVGEQPQPSLPVPYIQVPDSRKALGQIAGNFYGNPSGRKKVIGVTGTNGKTTTSFLLKHIFEQNGYTCSLVGTLHIEVNGEILPSGNTTPNALVLHKLLAESRDEVVIMEVSSHGLVQHRLEGIQFDCCLFMNLHRDHLDYHGTMEAYFKSKSMLFDKLKKDGTAVVNTDDYWGEKLAENLAGRVDRLVTIGSNGSNDLHILGFRKGDCLLIEEDGGQAELCSPMKGMHNFYNTALAYAAAKSQGIPAARILDVLPDFKGVSGRFEVTALPNGATAVIDYAHTADALHYCLTTAKAQGAGRLIHVFGFRGNRDEGKRADMLEVSAKISDLYILTSDDLNSETAEDMLKSLEVLNNEFGNEKGMIIPDRSLAIQRALEISNAGDWIVITGKGHESYKQRFQLGTNSDRETVRSISGLPS